MHIFPQIQIAGGKVITRGLDGDEDVVRAIDPIAAVRKFEAQGAKQMQVIDVDAARLSGRDNAALIRDMIDAAGVPIQVTGGLRTITVIEEWLEVGAASVALGTVAIQDPGLVSEVANRHPGAVFVNIATKNGYVVIDGWRTQTAFLPQDIVYDMQMSGVAGIIHTDIDRFHDQSASLALTMEISKNVVIPVYSSGTVHQLDDISTLQYLPNIHGVLLSKSLFDGSFDLSEALAVTAQNNRKDIVSDEPDATISVTQDIEKGIKLYLAGYNLSQAAQWWNRELRQAITHGNPYVEMIIPQEDLRDAVHNRSQPEVRAAYEQALNSSDAMLVILDGIENEAWTGFECGYARAHGKYLIGVLTQGYAGHVERFASMCDDLIAFEPKDDWSAMIEIIAREVNSHLLQHHASGFASDSDAGTIPE